jgi:hypothetical protein
MKAEYIGCVSGSSEDCREKCVPFPTAIVLRLLLSMGNAPKAKYFISFIGDSMTEIIYFAAKCAIEQIKPLEISENFSIKYIRSDFLRGDLPCADGCTDSKYSTGDWKNAMKCIACNADGKRKDAKTISELDLFPWLGNIPEGNNLVLMGSGAWYNFMQGFHSSKDEYLSLIKLLLPYLKGLIQKHNMTIYWQVCSISCIFKEYYS